jgi:hypothetical protein
MLFLDFEDAFAKRSKLPGGRLSIPYAVEDGLLITVDKPCFIQNSVPKLAGSTERNSDVKLN